MYNKKYIFCKIRKKFFILKPEECIRQNIIQFLIKKKKYNLSNIRVEITIFFKKIKKRLDIIVYKNKKPYLLIECKAPNIIISQNVFNQINQYNLKIKSKYLMISNGLKHFIYKIKKKKMIFLKKIPKNK